MFGTVSYLLLPCSLVSGTPSGFSLRCSTDANNLCLIHKSERGLTAGAPRVSLTGCGLLTWGLLRADFWINILLWILGWIPGVLHAWYVFCTSLSRKDSRRYF